MQFKKDGESVYSDATVCLRVCAFSWKDGCARYAFDHIIEYPEDAYFPFNEMIHPGSHAALLKTKDGWELELCHPEIGSQSQIIPVQGVKTIPDFPPVEFYE